MSEKTRRGKLVRSGARTGEMLAFLEKADIGIPDHLERGRWITRDDLPAILSAIQAQSGAVQCSKCDWNWQVPGEHEPVRFRQFSYLFRLNCTAEENDAAG